jgi:pSer/pThr/pTyr-binding forkhead associated (FHA) protein
MDLLLLLLRLLLAAALYLFLGTVLFLLWRDLRRSSETAPVRPRQYGRLLVVGAEVEGPDTEAPLQVGTSFPLQLVTSVGRSAVNTVTIPDAYASAEHAMLIYRGGQWWLEDRGSRNGTTVNALLIDGPTIVSSGDIVGIGRVQLKLELADL